jgi:hypothetical protein
MFDCQFFIITIDDTIRIRKKCELLGKLSASPPEISSEDVLLKIPNFRSGARANVRVRWKYTVRCVEIPYD